MIQSCTFQICVLDGIVATDSPVYQTIKLERGVKYANRWTKVVRVKIG